MYELHRKPHDMVADTSAIAVSPRALHSELMCPICLDLMTNTQTTKEVTLVAAWNQFLYVRIFVQFVWQYACVRLIYFLVGSI